VFKNVWGNVKQKSVFDKEGIKNQRKGQGAILSSEKIFCAKNAGCGGQMGAKCVQPKKTAATGHAAYVNFFRAACFSQLDS